MSNDLEQKASDDASETEKMDRYYSATRDIADNMHAILGVCAVEPHAITLVGSRLIFRGLAQMKLDNPEVLESTVNELANGFMQMVGQLGLKVGAATNAKNGESKEEGNPNTGA